MDSVTDLTLDELATQFLETLTQKKRLKIEPSVAKFVRWCGKDRLAVNVTGQEVERYAQDLSKMAATENSPHVRAFLNFAHKLGTFRISLAPSFRVRKSPNTTKEGPKRARVVSQLTAEGFERIQTELKELKSRRGALAEAIMKAAADKDFRENAPLEAAKERQGIIEARIRVLEASLATAQILGPGSNAARQRSAVGTIVTLKDVASGKEVVYTLVDVREADAASGKISTRSPVGQALLDRAVGDEVTVTVPRGTVSYLVEKING
jgi:transcription elongation factor GreA